MDNKEKILTLAKDMIRGTCPADFSNEKTNSQALRDMFIAANGGSSELSIKNFYRGSVCFDIVEEIIPLIVHEGFTGNEFWMNLVDYRNIELGDEQNFFTPDKADFIVSDLSYGTTGIRRQRLGKGQSYSIDTTLKGVKVYEEFKRFLAGRVDFNAFVDAVAKAMLQRLYEDVYNALKGVTSSTRGLSSTYVINGTHSEDELLDLCEHVSAANDGAKVIILGTKKALRKLNMETVSDSAKEDKYNMGYFGKFNGIDTVFMPQRHKVGTDEFLYEDNKLYVIAVGTDKPIKVVNVGKGVILDQRNNGMPVTADLTVNYTYAQEFGVGLVFATKMGFYTTA